MNEAEARYERQVPHFDSGFLVQKFAFVVQLTGLNGPTVLGLPDWTRFSPRGRTTQQVRFMLECLHSSRPDGPRRTPLYASISSGGDGRCRSSRR